MKTNDVWDPFEQVIRASRAGRPVANVRPLEKMDQNEQKAFLEWGLKHFEQYRMDELKGWLDENVGKHRANSVYLDTTTLVSAFELVSERQNISFGIFAFQLWDLSILVNAVVLFDRVFCCGPRAVGHTYSGSRIHAMNKLFGEEVIVELPVSENECTVEAMTDMWYQTQEFMRDLDRADQWSGFVAGERTRYYEAWSQFLDVPPESFALFDERTFESLYDSKGQQLIDTLIHTIDLTERTQYGYGAGRISWNKVIMECNLREDFNSRFAYAIDIPYLPNSFRAPARRARYERAKRLPSLLSSLILMDEVYAEQARFYQLRGQTSIALPLLLASLVARIDELSDFWQALAELRHRARSFRRHRQELDQACLEGNIKEIMKVERAIKGESVKPSTWLSPTGAALVAAADVVLTAIEPRLGAAALSAQLAVAAFGPFAKKHFPESMNALYKKLFAPRNWFLIDIGSAAREITNAKPKIERLWKARLHDRYGIQQLERLKSWGLTYEQGSPPAPIVPPP